MVLDNTVGGTVDNGTNSYCDLAYASAYWNAHWNTAQMTQWDAFTSTQQTSLLISACRILNTARFTVPYDREQSKFHPAWNRLARQVINYEQQLRPVKFYFYQVLQFPRNLDIDPGTGQMYIPDNILQAQCEQAIYLANFDQTALSNRLQGIVNDSVSIGRGQIHTAQQYGMEGSMFAPIAMELVKPYLVRGIQIRRA